jgi:adenylosuccinate lyase
LAGVVEKLLIYPERMKANLDLLGGLHNSQRVLLALTQAGASREEAYSLVQANAMAVWSMPSPRPSDALLSRLRADPKVTALLEPDHLIGLFDDSHHFAHVDTIFARVFG